MCSETVNDAYAKKRNGVVGLFDGLPHITSNRSEYTIQSRREHRDPEGKKRKRKRKEMPFTTQQTTHSFGGYFHKLSHDSSVTKCRMNVNLYLPPQAAEGAAPGSIPVLFWLSGLTCTPDNCVEKGFLHAAASKKGIAIVYPDTSPRGAQIEGEDSSCR